jgi:hypothetical protein
MEGGAVGHNFERDPPRDHPCQVWFNLIQRFQRRRFLIGIKNTHFVEDLPMIIPGQFGFNYPSGFREEAF